jgi:hypothetical protein
MAAPRLSEIVRWRIKTLKNVADNSSVTSFSSSNPNPNPNLNPDPYSFSKDSMGINENSLNDSGGTTILTDTASDWLEEDDIAEYD